MRLPHFNRQTLALETRVSGLLPMSLRPQLTSSTIVWMITPMGRKFVAVLVILGWVSLSGFDVVEDLDEIPGQVKVSSNSRDGSSTAKRGGWGPLANNMVESANPTEQADFSLISFTPIFFEFNRIFDLRRHLQLHKLYRVFLI